MNAQASRARLTAAGGPSSPSPHYKGKGQCNSRRVIAADLLDSAECLMLFF